MGRKAILKNLVDIVVMLKQDEEDKEKPEEEYKVEIPEGLRRKVQAILREKHKVKALAPDTGKWGGAGRKFLELLNPSSILLREGFLFSL